MSILTKPEERLAPSRTALIVIDMQNDFVAEGGYVERVVKKDASSCRAILPAVQETVEAARKASVPVIWVCADYSLSKISDAMRSRQLGISDAVCAEKGTWGAELYQVEVSDGEKTIFKHTFNAFCDTGLAAHIGDLGRESIVVVGVQTNVCVDHTVRDAICRGLHCGVVSDAVASHTRSLHDASLATLGALYADVLDLAKLKQLWSFPKTAE